VLDIGRAERIAVPMLSPEGSNAHPGAAGQRSRFHRTGCTRKPRSSVHDSLGAWIETWARSRVGDGDVATSQDPKAWGSCVVDLEQSPRIETVADLCLWEETVLARAAMGDRPLRNRSSCPTGLPARPLRKRSSCPRQHSRRSRQGWVASPTELQKQSTPSWLRNRPCSADLSSTSLNM
jgi:hypothetical protein